jgi:peptide deformylase
MQLSTDRKRLLQHSAFWDFSNPPMDIEKLSIDMIQLMNEEKGFGISYSQSDLPGNYAIFGLSCSPENLVCINPKIVYSSNEKYIQNESCLSFKGLVIPIERSREVRLRFNGPNGEVFTRVFKNLTARVIQHEMDHLQGKPFWHSISKLKFDMALRKAYKKGIDFSNLTYKGL